MIHFQIKVFDFQKSSFADDKMIRQDIDFEIQKLLNSKKINLNVLRYCEV